MMTFARNPQPRTKRFGSHFALALALVAGSTFGAVALEAPAAAQEEGEAQKKDYSEGFIAAYQPLAKRVEAKEDPNALKGAIPTVVSAAQTPDDKFAAGQLVYSIGSNAKDIAVQRQGLDMMLDSGKTPADQQGRNLFAAGQLAYQAEDWAAARSRFEEAVAAGYQDSNAKGLIAEAYFNEENYAAGLASLKQAIEAKQQAGEPVDEAWIRRGFAVAYNNALADDAAAFANLYVANYPSSDVWGDAIAVQRSFYDYDDQTLLDLMRLADRTDSLRNGRDYSDYILAADPLRLPGEVSRVLAEGLAANMLNEGDVLVTEARTTSEAQMESARADLPELESGARGSGSAVDAMAAGDMFLNFEQPAKAAEMYELALTKSGVDTGRALTRLGIAQVDQGQFAEAKTTFDKVDGARAPVADLWGLYAAGQVSGGATAAAPAAEATATAAPAQTPAQ
ncbi:hypothetical protein [Pelagerythrobacter sp.]|uniref:hypothetical protein n=1 Tax=Pelagerythrobacter sp. TaxID=2800702 RepID=UPI0035B115ED